MIHRTFCRNCPSVCGLIVETKDNTITAIRGDRDHALTAGYLCIKGLETMDLHNGEDRVDAPLKRQDDGRFAPIDFQAAMDEIHGKLARIIDAHGPEAVAVYYGTGCNNNSLSQSAMKAGVHMLRTPFVFSSMTIDQSAKWVTAGRMGMFLPGHHILTDADVIISVGANALVSHTAVSLPMANPKRWISEARRNGARLIVVDPRRTETAREADLHLQIKPGEDAALFAGMIRLLFERKLYDAAFCDRFVTSMETLERAVSDFTLDLVARRTGLEPALIEQAAEEFAHAGRKSVATGTGPDMGPHSNTTNHIIEAFNALCGGYRREGDTIRNVGLLFGRVVAKEIVLPPNRSWDAGPKLKSADIGPLFGEYPTALLPDEILRDDEDRIRALIVIGGNPAVALSEPDKTLAALRRLELMVTVDPRPTPTARLSHYQIPTTLLYERFDFSGMHEPCYPVAFAQASRPIVEPPAGVIQDWEFFWELARRMGRPLALKLPMLGGSQEQIPGPELSLDTHDKPQTEDIVRWMCSHGMVTFDQLMANPGGVLIEGSEARVQAVPDDGARLDLCPPDVAREIATVRDKGEETDAEYPFRLTVRRMIETMNSAYSNASKTRRRFKVNPAFMHPEDMADAGIANHGKVEIASRFGTIFAQASADPSLRRGMVSMAHAWGEPDIKDDPAGSKGAFSGRLISLTEDLEPVNFMPRQSGVFVKVRPLGDGER